MNEHTADLTAYSAVEEAIVHQLPSGRWFAAVRLRVAGPRESGSGIAEVEDLHRRFDSEDNAYIWVGRKVVQFHRLKQGASA